MALVYALNCIVTIQELIIMTIYHVITDVMDKFNRAPIHQASGCGQKNMVQFLVEECGCDMGEAVFIL